MPKTPDLEGLPDTEGVAPKKIKALDTAIDEWRSIVEKRMSLTEKEVSARDGVMALMHKHGITAYPYWVSDDEQKLVVLDSTEKLKLKKADAGEDAPGDPEDDGDND